MRPGVRHGTKSRSSIVFISRPSEVKDLSWSIYQHDSVKTNSFLTAPKLECISSYKRSTAVVSPIT